MEHSAKWDCDCPKISLSSDYLLITDTAKTVNGYVSNKNNELVWNIF